MVFKTLRYIKHYFDEIFYIEVKNCLFKEDIHPYYALVLIQFF
jgi:hypothetical protein